MEFKRLIENLNEYEHINQDKELYELIEKLYLFDVNELIHFESPYNTKNREIRNILNEIDFKLKSLSKYTKNDIIPILKTTIQLFEKSLKTNDLKYFMIFSYINLNINIDIVLLSENLKLKPELEKMVENISNLLNNITISSFENMENLEKDKLDLNTTISNKIKEDFELMNLTINSLNIQKKEYLFHRFKIYTPKLIQGMIKIFKEHNFNLFTSDMINLENIILTAIFVKELTDNEIKDIFYKNDIKNLNTLFVFLKRFIDSDENQNMVIVKEILFKIFNINLNLFKEIIRLFKDKNLLNKSIGLLLSNTSEENIPLIIDCFDINMTNYNDMAKTRREILRNIDNTSPNYNKTLNIVYSKWNLKINKLLKKSEGLLNLVCSDFYYFIIEYYMNFYDDDKIINKMQKYFEKLININSEWAENLINQINKIHIYITKLLILSEIYKLKSLNDENIIKYANILETNTYLTDNLLNKEMKSTLKKLMQNLL